MNVRAQEPAFTTVCALVREPAAFAGKLVKLRAKVITGFEASLIVEPDQSCKRGLWFQIAPEKEEQGKSLDDRDAILQQRQPAFLLKDESFQKFEDALGAEVYPRREDSVCMMCLRYDVTAMMVGRVDYAGEHEMGFGHLNGARLRFVMVSVSDVSTVEKAYDWGKYSRTPIRSAHGTIEGIITDFSGNPARFAELEPFRWRGTYRSRIRGRSQKKTAPTLSMSSRAVT